MENNGCSAGPLDVVVRLRALDREGYQPLTGAIGEEAAAEIERLRQDTKRLDFLDWLMTRTEFQNRERPNVPVKSDPHAWLTDQAVPIDQADFDEANDVLFGRERGACHSGMCFV